VTSWELDYNYTNGNKIVLKDLRLPPDGTMYWQE
jgi:hypothetical protein